MHDFSHISGRSDREELILSAFGMGILEWEPGAKIANIDSRVAELFGFDASVKEMTMELMMERIHPHDRDRIEATLGNALENGKACEEEFRVVDEAGEIRWLAGSCRPMEEPGGLWRLLCLCYDVTKRREFTDQKLSDILDAVETEKSLIGAAIHDTICQDLRGIGLQSEALQHTVSTTESVSPEISNGIELVRRLLSDATGRAVNLARGISPLSVKNQTLQESLTEMLSRFTELYPHIRFDLKLSGPPMASDNQQIVDQLFCVAQEAIRNAVHHGNPSRIAVSLEIDETLARQMIEDDGGGDAQQLQASREQSLGLRIMEYRMDSIGGKLRVENRADGSGIRITSTVPTKQKAANSEEPQGANIKAIDDLLSAIETTSNLPRSTERDEKELELQLELVPLLMANRGFAVPEVGSALERAHELCTRLPRPDSKQLFSAARGLWQFHQVRSEADEALARSHELVEVAEREDDGFLAEAHRTVGGTTLFRGEFLDSRSAFERSIETYTEDSFFTAEDPLILSLYEGAWALWLLGEVDEARKRAAEAVFKAQDSENPFSLAVAKYGSVMMRAFEGDFDSVVILAEELRQLANSLNFGLIVGATTIPLGWALFMQGNRKRGLAELRSGITTCEATGTEMQMTAFKGFLADALRHGGKHSEALVVVESALELALRNREHWWLAELQRLQGESTLAMWPNSPEKAETCFRRALETARAQSARSWELRAATSLANLLFKSGERGAAKDLLAPIASSFAGSSDNADLRKATSLLAKI